MISICKGFGKKICEEFVNREERSNRTACAGVSMGKIRGRNGSGVGTASLGAEKVQPLFGKTHGHLPGGKALPVQTGDEGLVRPDPDHPGRFHPDEAGGEAAILPAEYAPKSRAKVARLTERTSTVWSTPSSIRASGTGQDPPP